MPPAAIDIHALTPQRLPDLLDFFDHRAFPDNPKWQSCYCHFPHADHARIVWKDRDAAQNRAATCERIAAGTMNGWLAYADERAIGWCNAGPRRDIAGLFRRTRAGGRPDRRDRLLRDRAGIPGATNRDPVAGVGLRGLRAQGYAWAEGYPRRAGVNAADSHYGPLAMYDAAGFAVVKRDPDGGLTVRRTLTPRIKCEAGR